MQGPVEIHRTLLAADIPHEIVQLPHSLARADSLPDVLGLPNEACLVVRLFHVAPGDPPAGQPGPLPDPLPDPQPDRPAAAAAVVAAGQTPSPGAVGAALRVRVLGVLPARSVPAVTGYLAGLVCPIGLPADVPLVVESRALTQDVVYLATGAPGSVVGLRAADLVAVTGAATAELRALPSARGRARAHPSPPPLASGPTRRGARPTIRE